MYECPGGDLLAITHAELNAGSKGGIKRADQRFPLGLGYSTDRGAGWTYCGEIVRPADDRHNVGGGAYIIRGDYLYVFEAGDTRRINIWDLDRAILIDPSMGEKEESDESGIIVTGTDEKGNIYLLETIKRRLRPPEIIEEWIRLIHQWSPRISSVEAVSFSGILGYWFRDKCSEMRLHPTVVEYKPGSRRSKKARIRGLANYFASGQIYIMEGQHQFRDEYEAFGITDSEHLLDALAQGIEVWKSPGPHIDADELRDAEDYVMNQRSAITGY